MQFRDMTEAAADTMRAVPGSKIDLVLTERGPLARIRVAEPHLSIDIQWGWHETKVPGKLMADLERNLSVVRSIAD